MGADGGAPAIEEFRAYLAAVARLQVAARPWLGGKLDASDLAQQALLKAHAAREQFRGRTPAGVAKRIAVALAAARAQLRRRCQPGTRPGVVGRLRPSRIARASRL